MSRVRSVGDEEPAGPARASLERRYRRLLRFYPAAYRQSRSDEIIDTLMEGVAPGQRRPTVRDAWALVGGGLRARSGADHRDGLPVDIRTAALFGMILFVADMGTGALLTAYDRIHLWIHYGANQAMHRWEWQEAATGLMMVVIALLLWTGRKRLALLPAFVAAALAVYPYIAPVDIAFELVVPLTVALLTLWFARHPGDRAVPRVWGWFLLAYLTSHQVWANLLGPYVASTRFWIDWGHLVGGWFLSYWPAAFVLAWLIIDARLAIAVATISAIFLVDDLARGLLSLATGSSAGESFVGLFQADNAGYLIISYGVLVTVAAGGLLGLRRQAAL